MNPEAIGTIVIWGIQGFCLLVEYLSSMRVLNLDPGTMKSVKFTLFPVRSLCFTGSVDE